jgi:hypothetical protein
VFDAQSAIRLNSASTQWACTWHSLSCVLVFSGSGRKYLPIFIAPVLIFVIILFVVLQVGVTTRQLRYIFSLTYEFMRANGRDVCSQLAQDFFNRVLLALCFRDGSSKEDSTLPAVAW